MTFDPNAGVPNAEVPPPPGAPTPEEKNWAVIAHLSSFLAAYVALGVIGPTVVYFVKGNTSSFVRAHSVEAINFNITMLIGILVSIVLTFVLVGFATLLVIGIVYLIATIKGAMAASNGQLYRYPMTIRFIS